MENNIKSIAIVDDTPENLKAAVIAINEFLPNANVSTFNSAADFFNEVGNDCPKFDFVISDMNMEEKHSGFKVACLCWSWMVPTIIVSGGPGHGRGDVTVGHLIGFHLDGKKEDVYIWKSILEKVFVGGLENPINLALNYGKKSKQDMALGEIGGYSSALRFF